MRGCGLGEGGEARQQPAGREGADDADGNGVGEVAVLEALQGFGQAAEGLGDGGQQRLAFVGQRQAARQAAEQLGTEARLQGLDLLADGGLRHAQFEAGAREAEMTRRRLERAQGVERKLRQARRAAHASSIRAGIDRGGIIGAPRSAYAWSHETLIVPATQGCDSSARRRTLRMMGRRKYLLATSMAMTGLPLLGATKAAFADEALAAELRRLESESGGRLGVSLLDTKDGARAGHRRDERFPLCSTFKAVLAAAVLRRVDVGEEQLARRVRFGAEAVLAYAPVTKTRVGGEGMTIAELCDAAVTLSDNTAANLLLAAIGGPAALTAFLRSIGDDVTRLDRTEPTLNEALPGDPRDTTTPDAMASTLRTLVVGEALSPGSRTQLVAWLVANKTGDARLRAGLPRGWRVGDKTGTGARGTANDIAAIWPEDPAPGRAPLIVTAYLTGATVEAAQQNAVLAGVGRAVAAAAT
jgi:beta-lactamase class A